jgi:short-chain Z-isoprenyl diphosphate synthase
MPCAPRRPGRRLKRGLRELLYSAYERRLLADLQDAPTPRHVGVILDGNRRWARAVDAGDVTTGYRRGADRIRDLLDWCDEAGVEVVTLWLLSTDNLARPQAELAPLLRIIEATVEALAEPDRPWRVHPVGALDLLPGATAAVLKDADERTSDKDGIVVNVAVGYGGRREIADAVRSLLQEHASRGTSIEELAALLEIEHIADHLYTRGQPDPDLVIRTSGEQRLSGFLLWQSAHSEFYFCEAFWPDFRRIDFLRALRAYALRSRRFGT